MKQTYISQRAVKEEDTIDQSRDTLHKNTMNIKYVQKTFKEN